jgi:3-methyladenine DNA glycosylase AlkD
MVSQCQQTRKRAWLTAHSEEEGEQVRRGWYEFYLAHTDKINNWDLVDLTAPTIVGSHLIGKSHDILYRLADSSLLWDQRIAVISTFAFIRQSDFTDIYALAAHLLHHPHDLMQKAIGWMLREAGKRDKTLLLAFLDDHSAEMPRTMLRYAIEKFTVDERAHYMKH